MRRGVAGLSAVERGGKKLRGGRLIRKHWSKAEENLLAEQRDRRLEYCGKVER